MDSSASHPRKRVVLLGATGSIGENALRVIAAHRDRLELTGIAARGNWRRLAAIAREFGVRHVGIFDADSVSPRCNMRMDCSRSFTADSWRAASAPSPARD